MGRSYLESDDEYEKLIQSMNSPRVEVDNDSSTDTTVIKVECANKHEITLQVVQALNDLNLIITKARISSDSMWLLDDFHVTDQNGKKLRDGGMIDRILDYLRKSLGAASGFVHSRRILDGVVRPTDHTTIELTGADRTGLLSEVIAVLTDLDCNVVKAEIWTHNGRAAAILQVMDSTRESAIPNQEKLSRIKEILCRVIKSPNKDKRAKVAISLGVIPMDRRLHQMMFAYFDYKRWDQLPSDENQRPHVTIANDCYKDYTTVTLRCKGRPKLLFDAVCTLTDLMYSIFHGNFQREGPEAKLELYIRHIDGLPVSSEAEKIRLTQCLETAIERRVFEADKLEFSLLDKPGLLANITRIFREDGAHIRRATVATAEDKAFFTFYLQDILGRPLDTKTIATIWEDIVYYGGPLVKGHSDHPGSSLQDFSLTDHCETPRPPQVHLLPFFRTISWQSIINCLHSPPSL